MELLKQLLSVLLIFAIFLQSNSHLVSARYFNYYIQTYGNLIDSNRDLFFERLRHDRDNNILCDFSFEVENQSYCAHKTILMASSEYFQAMFSSDSEGDKELEFLELKNVSKTHFELIWDYMYGKRFDFVDCPLQDIVGAYELADTWFLQTFKEECVDFVSNWPENGHVCKCYDIAKELKMDQQLKEMIGSVSKFIFSGTTDLNLSIHQIKLENVPFKLLTKTLSSITGNPKYFSIVCNWLFSQTDQDYFKDNYLNSVFENVPLEQLTLIEIRAFFVDHFQKKTYEERRVLQLQLSLQDLISIKRANVFFRLNLHLMAAAHKKMIMKVDFYDPKGNNWQENTYPALFDIRETLVDSKNQLFMFNQAYHVWKTNPCQYSVFDLPNRKATETFSTFTYTDHIIRYAFVYKTKLYFLTQTKTNYAIIIVYDTVSKENMVYQMPFLVQGAYGGFFVKDEIVYYSVSNTLYKFDPRIGVTSNVVVTKMPYTPNSVSKMLMTKLNEMIYVFNNYIMYMKSDLTFYLETTWNVNFVHLTPVGVFVMMPAGEDEIKLSFYDYEDIRNKTLKERVVTHVAKPLLGADATVKYFFKNV